MLKHNKLYLSISILLMGFYLVSCNSDSKDFAAQGDVVFLKKEMNGQEVFGASYYVYGNEKLVSATVTTPLATTIELAPYATNSYYYYSEPDSNEFSTSSPAEGTYSFNVTNSDGTSVVVSDFQNFDNLDFAQIDSFAYYNEYDEYYVAWNVVSNADIYVVNLYNSANNIIFTSYSVAADSPAYVLSYGYYGTWDESPVSGNTYTIQIKSIKYDSDVTNDDYSYNVQEISYSKTEFVWGDETE